MSRIRSKRLLAACCIMDLCWLCALSNFIIRTTTPIRFPIWGGLAAFLLPLGITRFYTINNYRRIWPVLLHVCGLYFLYRWQLTNLFDWWPPKTQYQWYQVVIVIMLIGLFWYKGTRLATRQDTYKTICNHFDLGVSLLFLLTCIQFMLELKVGIKSEDPFTFQCMGFYFLAGLIALIFSYNEMGGDKAYLKGFQTYGILISATVMLLFVAIGSFLFFQPAMTAIAESGYAGVKTMAGSIGPYIKAIILFLLKGQGALARNEAAAQSQGGSGWFQAFDTGQVDHPVIMGILILFAAAVAGLFLYLVWRLLYLYILRLFVKPDAPVGARNFLEILSRLIGRMIYWFNIIIDFIRAIRQNPDTSLQGFVKLVKWGKRSGVKKQSAETPLEYAGRLQNRFQPLKEEIEIIISAFQLEVYGETATQPHVLLQVSRAVKKLYSPAFWVLRLKSILQK